MPLVDMPLEKLKSYEGRNPKPADFDAYWDRALAEMNAVDPDVKLVPSEFTTPFAEFFDLYFTGVRGARVHARFARPKHTSGEPHPAIVRFHGYSGDSGDWCGLIGEVASGYSIAALDCRGQGGTSEDLGGVKGTTLHGHIIRGLDDSEDNLLFRHMYLDTAQLAKIVMAMPDVDETRVGAHGGSQGGGLTLACASLVPEIKFVAPSFPFLCDYQRVWEMDLATGAYEELRQFFRHHDPRHEREEEIFTRLGYIDCQHLADRIKGEVLMFTGLMDTICPPSTQFAAYNKITAKKNVVIYPDFGHEGLPGSGDMIYQLFSKL